MKGNRRQTGKHNTQKRVTAWNPDTADSAGYMGSESEVINDDKDGSRRLDVEGASWTEAVSSNMLLYDM